MSLTCDTSYIMHDVHTKALHGTELEPREYESNFPRYQLDSKVILVTGAGLEAA